MINLPLLCELLHLGHACVQDVRRSCAGAENHLEACTRGDDERGCLVIEGCPGLATRKISLKIIDRLTKAISIWADFLHIL